MTTLVVGQLDDEVGPARLGKARKYENSLKSHYHHIQKYIPQGSEQPTLLRISLPVTETEFDRWMMNGLKAFAARLRNA